MDEKGPIRATRPQSRGGRRREVNFRRGFDSLLPFFVRHLNRNFFELDQQTNDRVVQLQLAVVAVLVRRQRRDQRGDLSFSQRSKQVALQGFANQQGPIDAQIRQPFPSLSYSFSGE